MGMDVGMGRQWLIKGNLPFGDGIYLIGGFGEEIQVVGNKNA